MIIFIEEDESGVVNISTLFVKRYCKTDYKQHEVTKMYLSIKENLAADHLEYFSYCEYDFFHKLFYPQSQYQSAWNLLSGKRYHIKIWRNKKRFYRFYEIRSTNGYVKPFLKWLYNLTDSVICRIHNYLVFEAKEVLIFEYQEKDFRNRRNFDYLRLKHSPSLALGSGVADKLKKILDPNIYFIRNLKPVIWGNFQYSKYLRFMGMSCLSQEALTNKFFRNTKTEALIGIDDPSFARPFIKGCRDSGVITIGVQHGLYGYENIGYSDIEKSARWYNYLICWDEISKKIFMENNKSFSEQRIYVGTDFFVTGHTKGAVKDTIFLIGEENIDSALLDNIVSMMLQDNWKILCLMKGGRGGKKPDITYVRGISEVPFERCAALIGSKSSLVYQLSRLDIPTFIVPCGEGYLSELCRYLSLKELSQYSKLEFEGFLENFQPPENYNDEPRFCENISRIFKAAGVLQSDRGAV